MHLLVQGALSVNNSIPLAAIGASLYCNVVATEKQKNNDGMTKSDFI